MNAASRRIFVQNIVDGKSVSAVLRSNMTLSQYVTEDGSKCFPNWNAWEEGAVTPIVYAYTRLSGTETPATPSSVVWKWNGGTIEFDANGYSTNYVDTSSTPGTSRPYFQKDVYRETPNGTQWPCLKILHNLAQASGSIDNDLITCEATVETGGTQLPFSVDIPVRISQVSGTGYLGVIEGQPFVSEVSPSTTLSAKLYANGEQVQAFRAKFYIEPMAGVAATVDTVNGVATFTITNEDITDNVTIRCEFLLPPKVQGGAYTRVETALFDVDDESDTEEMQVGSQTYDGSNVVGTGADNVLLRAGQAVLFTVWMGHRMEPDNVDDRYNKFFFQLTNSEDKVLVPVSTTPTPGAEYNPSALKPDGYPNTYGTVWTENNRYFDCTGTGTVGTQSGKTVGGVRFDFDLIASFGNGIGGVFVAAVIE